MELGNPRGAVWTIYPDCPVTRRKWYHKAVCGDEFPGYSSRRFEECLKAVLEHDPAEILLQLPDGPLCRIERLPPARKEPD